MDSILDQIDEITKSVQDCTLESTATQAAPTAEEVINKVVAPTKPKTPPLKIKRKLIIRPSSPNAGSLPISPSTTPPQKLTQSQGLSNRIITMNQLGQHFTDDSSQSEYTLSQAIDFIKTYAADKVKQVGGTLTYKTSISLFECQQAFHAIGGPVPNPENKKVSMKPDGGIFYMELNGKSFPILITEDKVQGTNDSRLAAGLSKQATGNAIERAGKNIRGAEMLCANMDIFPYVLFASGCDFHHSETIAKRIEMMNYGVSNNYIEITPESTNDSVNTMVEQKLESLSIKKLCGQSIASVFIKAHKWDVMPHRASLWTKAQYILVCCRVVDLSISAIMKYI